MAKQAKEKVKSFEDLLIEANELGDKLELLLRNIVRMKDDLFDSDFYQKYYYRNRLLLVLHNVRKRIDILLTKKREEEHNTEIKIHSLKRVNRKRTK